MGRPSDDDEHNGKPTAQQHYYSHLAYPHSHGDERNVVRLAQLQKDGPPAPVSADGARGWLRWHARHVPTVDEFAELLSKLEGERLLTPDEVTGYRGKVPADSVAELVAKVQSVDAIADAHRDGRPS
ncbi:hypothetical protein ACTD5D_23360 [Nocardia takedensis]|uniref:hypothetical protein n=1 Tax=Nocardia takedensis TaxID=259390 RepID=UPI003F76A287